MFAIDVDVPAELYPLAWLVGKWRGWGSLTKEEGEPLVVVESEYVVSGTTLRETTTIWNSQNQVDLPVMATAAQGYEALVKGDVRATFTASWQVKKTHELPQIDPATGRSTIMSELEVTSEGGLHGLKLVWQGNCQGPRIALASQVEGAADAPNISEVTRMYGLVMSELMWAQDTTVAGESGTELAVRVGRE